MARHSRWSLVWFTITPDRVENAPAPLNGSVTAYYYPAGFEWTEACTGAHFALQLAGAASPPPASNIAKILGLFEELAHPSPKTAVVSFTRELFWTEGSTYNKEPPARDQMTDDDYSRYRLVGVRIIQGKTLHHTGLHAYGQDGFLGPAYHDEKTPDARMRYVGDFARP